MNFFKDLNTKGPDEQQSTTLQNELQNNSNVHVTGYISQNVKTNVVYGRNRYFYWLIWDIAGSSSRDRNFVMSFHSFRFAPLVKIHKIYITRGRSTGLPYQRMKETFVFIYTHLCMVFIDRYLIYISGIIVHYVIVRDYEM
jgi:hypothetical protein